jgi:hypothetical protein
MLFKGKKQKLKLTYYQSKAKKLSGSLYETVKATKYDFQILIDVSMPNIGKRVQKLLLDPNEANDLRRSMVW